MTHIFITTQFEGVHYWPGAPLVGPAEYLRHPHRHMFHVRVEIAVSHDDRQIEFITLKEQVTTWLRNTLSYPVAGAVPYSCELMARMLWQYLGTTYPVIRIEVSEDGENGAIISDLG